MLNYNHLHYFHVVAGEGSVAGAAEKLGVTQPTVSEQVRALERALGAALFDRTPGGLRLTDAGRLAFEHTSVMFRAGERLVESLGPNAAAVPRTLRIGISGGVARATTTTFLMPLLALDACLPTIRGGDAAELVRDLRAMELDLALIENEPAPSDRRGLTSTLIDEVTLVAVAAPELPIAPDWANVRIVQYRASSAYRWEVEAYLDANGYAPHIAAECDDAQFLVEAATRGGHVAFVPRAIARDAIAAQRLRVIGHLGGTGTGVFALYSDGAATELARRAVEILLEQARARRDA